jgi:16S rRNA (cytosine1402-N4)-methyltransferase
VSPRKKKPKKADLEAEEPVRVEGELLEGIQDESEISHEPVMVQEVLAFASAGGREVVLDGTLGLGGHAEAILSDMKETKVYVGMDVDPRAVDWATRRLEKFTRGKRPRELHLSHRSYVDAAAALDEAGVDEVDVAILDLGASTYQLTTPDRGFSVTRSGPLDMRMDTTKGKTARQLLESWDANQLREVLAAGEVKFPGRVARAIHKNLPTIATTADLAHVVQRAVPVNAAKRKYIHPATLVFQALRIAVNSELDNVRTALPVFHDRLKKGGRLIVISFHSLEDRIVKQFMQRAAKGDPDPDDPTIRKKDMKPTLELLAKRPLVPGEAELSQNAASRSAKLRVARKL